MFKQANIFIAICMFGLNFPCAYAATSTAIINVSLTVTNVCSVNASPAVLPTLQAAQTGRLDVDMDNATSIFTVNCSKGAGYAIELDEGRNIATLSQKIHRNSSADYINYSLYLESGRKIPWTSNARLLGTGANQAVMTYGSPFLIQEIRNVGSAGNADQIFATVTY